MREDENKRVTERGREHERPRETERGRGGGRESESHKVIHNATRGRAKEKRVGAITAPLFSGERLAVSAVAGEEKEGERDRQRERERQRDEKR